MSVRIRYEMNEQLIESRKYKDQRRISTDFARGLVLRSKRRYY